MTTFASALSTGQTLLMDGAMGSQLVRAGARFGDCFELWNLQQPDVVRDIHQAYVEAGARVLLTNTFQAHPHHLQRYNLADRGREIVQAAIRLARAAGGTFVLGDIGPMHTTKESTAFADRAAVEEVLCWFTAENNSAVDGRGVDGLLFETASDASVFDAVRWTHAVTDLPIVVSLTYRSTAAGPLTLAGQSPPQIARLARQAGVAALGVNCGVDQGTAELIATLKEYRKECALPLMVRPNAGTPTQSGDGWRYPVADEKLADAVAAMVELGAVLIGGCCGTTPDTIRRFHGNLQELQASGKCRLA